MTRALVAPLVAGLLAGGAVYALASDEDPRRRERAAAAPEGLVVFRQAGCGSCHALSAAGSRGEIGPSLDERLRFHTRESLRAIITDPPPSAMPTDFGTRLSDAQLTALVDFLAPG